MGKLPRAIAMPRKNRLFIEGFPHLTQLKGHNGELLFREENDYTAFELALALAAKRYAVEIHSYSLATERVLLMVSAESRLALSSFIQYLGRRYVPYYNHRYQRYGSLWENRYSCSPLQASTYFLIVKRFIECNEDGVKSHHSDGLSPKDIIVPHQEWLNLADDEVQQHRRFKEFCCTPLNAALVIRIRNTLSQNCLLATPAVSKRLESQLACSLQARHRGRPRKYTPSNIDIRINIEQHAAAFLRQRGYQQVRLSLIENEFLLTQKNSTLFSPVRLRRDGTTGCLRLMTDTHSQQSMSRIWYSGTMFGQRHHNQSLQQSDQVGAEAFDMAGIDIELEQLVLQALFFKQLGIAEKTELHLNMLGDPSALKDFRRALDTYYRPHAHLFAPEQQEELKFHPERLINSNDPLLQLLATTAPNINDHISTDSQQRFIRLQLALNQAGIAWHHDTQLFPRNEYCQIVFEWRNNDIVISRGGRYDASASRTVGYPIAACGFAFLIGPIAQLFDKRKVELNSTSSIDIVIIASQPRVAVQTVLLARKLRQQFPELSIMTDSSQLRMATRHKNSRNQGAKITLEVEGDGYSLRLYKAKDPEYETTTIESVGDHLGKILWFR